MRTQTDLADALHTLRLLVRDVGGNYLAGLQAEVARIQRVVKATEKPDAKQMRAMLHAIAALEIKPQKGRRRDLKELDRLVSKLSDTIDNW